MANQLGFHPQSWSEAISHCSQENTDYVLVTILGAAGSTPRASGTKMVITADNFYDTIGGGHLEFKAIDLARQQLLIGNAPQHIEHLSLGASLGQCCGGSVTLLFETIIPQKLSIDVFGAGHVAHALIPMFAGLPVNVRWIDSREELFPQPLPTNVTAVIENYPEDCVQTANPNTASIVLTHNHQLDFNLCEKIIKRGDGKFLGVIGSASKAKRFQMRLTHKGFSKQQINAMTCPIGNPDISGKRPMEVAVSICAQIIGLYQEETEKSIRQGIAWKHIKNTLTTQPTLQQSVEDHV